MPFAWLDPAPETKNRSSHNNEVYKQELRERAALLYRLHYSAEEAKARLVANVGWDFEVGSSRAPVDKAEVGTIVDAIYARHGVGAGPLTV